MATLHKAFKDLKSVSNFLTTTIVFETPSNQLHYNSSFFGTKICLFEMGFIIIFKFFVKISKGTNERIIWNFEWKYLNNIFEKKTNWPLESSSSMVVELSVEALGSLDESPFEFFAIDLAAKKRGINIWN